MRYLIVGLGNPGAEYAQTRHNIGFRLLDLMAEGAEASFVDGRYGWTCTVRAKSAELVLLKPSTYMNLSGNAVRYWLEREKVPVERLLVVCDDLALPLGKLRMKPGGSSAGHNGLKHIAETLGTEQYGRLRFGIGNDYPRGMQVDYVLGRFSDDDEKTIAEQLPKAAEAVKAFALCGIQFAMNHHNR